MKNLRGDITPTTYSVNEFISNHLKGQENNVSELFNIYKILSGFERMDNCDRFTTGDLMLISSRPGMGRTAFVLSMLLEMSRKNNTRIVFFSLERNAMHIFRRLIIANAELDESKFSKSPMNEFDMKKLLKSNEELLKSTILVEDESFLRMEDLVERAAYLKVRSQIEVIIIDFSQTYIGFSEKPENINRTVKTLKKMAVDLNCLVIIISQLPPATEQRENKKPRISDLYHYGDSIKHIDIIGFIYRPEYYGILCDDEGNSNSGKALLILDKFHRDMHYEILFDFYKEWGKFKESTWD